MADGMGTFCTGRARRWTPALARLVADEPRGGDGQHHTDDVRAHLLWTQWSRVTARRSRR